MFCSRKDYVFANVVNVGRVALIFEQTLSLAAFLLIYDFDCILRDGKNEKK